jgi:hypothetical protein
MILLERQATRVGPATSARGKWTSSSPCARSACPHDARVSRPSTRGTREHASGEDRGAPAPHHLSSARTLPRRRDASWGIKIDAAMAGHPIPADGPRLDDMYAVQVVWDETMADTAARWLESAGDASQLIVLAGAGHCHQRAIPARLSRRIGAPVLSVSAVLASELSAYRDRHRYDWLLVLDDERDGSS